MAKLTKSPSAPLRGQIKNSFVGGRASSPFSREERKLSTKRRERFQILPIRSNRKKG